MIPPGAIHMSEDPRNTAPKPPPPDIEVDVINPRYEGATFEMVVKAMLQRPRKGGKPTEKTTPMAARVSRRAGNEAI